MSTFNSGDFVSIGDKIRHEEEYIGIKNTTYNEDGYIFAAIPGTLQLDEIKRTLFIESEVVKHRILPQPDDIIIGQIYSIRKHSIGVHVHTLNNKLVVDQGLVANIHVSMVAKSYVESLDGIFQSTDIVRARVVAREGNEYKVATNSSNLGVLKSQCKFCGGMMKRKGKNQVICPICNHYERKIMADDFGQFDVEIAF